MKTALKKYTPTYTPNRGQKVSEVGNFSPNQCHRNHNEPCGNIENPTKASVAQW